MTRFAITRQHVSPDNEEHAAMCSLYFEAKGDFQEAKNVMAEKVIAHETPAGALPFLRGLIATTELVEITGPLGGKWTGRTWTEDDVRWTIRLIK